MLQLVVYMKVNTHNKHCRKLENSRFKMPNIFILPPLPASKRNDPRMINLLQENKEMKSHRTNSTFGFCRHTGKRRKTKRAIFFQGLKISSIFGYLIERVE